MCVSLDLAQSCAEFTYAGDGGEISASGSVESAASIMMTAQQASRVMTYSVMRPLSVQLQRAHEARGGR